MGSCASRVDVVDDCGLSSKQRKELMRLANDLSIMTADPVYLQGFALSPEDQKKADELYSMTYDQVHLNKMEKLNEI